MPRVQLLKNGYPCCSCNLITAMITRRQKQSLTRFLFRFKLIKLLNKNVFAIMDVTKSATEGHCYNDGKCKKLTYQVYFHLGRSRTTFTIESFQYRPVVKNQTENLLQLINYKVQSEVRRLQRERVSSYNAAGGLVNLRSNEYAALTPYRISQIKMSKRESVM